MKNSNSYNTTPFKVAPIAIAVGSALALMSAPAFAADNQVALDRIQVIDSSEKGYKAEAPSSPKFTQEMVNTPKTINVVNEQVLEDQGVTSLEDALRNVSGVSTFGAGEGGGGNVNTSDNVTIRGFDANGSIYSDGIRDVAGYSRDTFNIEQVEVAKGANGSIYGKGSAGGSVNLVSKAAHLRGDKNSINASYDEGDTKRLTGDFNKVLSEDSAIRLNLMAEQGGDYWDNGEEEYKSYAIAPSYFERLSEDTDFTINFLHTKQDNTPVIGLPFITEQTSAALGIPEGTLPEEYWSNYYGVKGRDFEELDATVVTAIINHKLSPEWNLRSQTRFGETETKSIIHRPWPENLGDRNNPDYTGNYGLVFPKTDFSKNQLLVTQLDFIGEKYMGNVRHDIVIGAEAYRESQKTPNVDLSGYSYSKESYNPLNPGEITATGNYSIDGYSKDATANGLAAYLHDTVTLNEHWQVAAGARLENYDVDSTQNVGRGDSATSVSASSDANLFSWNTSINFKPTRNGSIYLSVANNQEPNGNNLSLNGRNAEQVSEYTSLDPLESMTTELGTKWELLDDRLLLSAAVFRTTKDVYDTIDEQLATSGEQESKGFELSATGQLTDALAITASYTRQDAKVTENYSNPEAEGNGLTAAPDDSAALWMTYASGPLTLGAGAEYQSGNDFWRRNTVYFTTGDITLVNAMAGYAFTENLSAQLNVSNLTDERYATDYSAKGHFKPGNPRNVKVSVKYDF
ncbi:TonB-dependent receptor [Marinomonas gallaica]|uniref:TonB-dependent receptor n=1 Tax=Marinomonas gallaica TaxID=1806667 RepID=UPI0008369DB7|nr:TonB-dependent siderophore receptor [Marinomonas gallaica]